MAAAKKTVNQAEEMFTKAQQGFEAAGAFGQETMEAVAKSTEITAKAVEALNAEIAAFSKKSFEDTVAAAKDIAAAKSPTELFEKQTAFATSAFEGFLEQAAKWNQAMGVATKEAMAPIEARVTAASDLAKTYAA